MAQLRREEILRMRSHLKSISKNRSPQITRVPSHAESRELIPYDPVPLPVWLLANFLNWWSSNVKLIHWDEMIAPE